MYKSAHMDDESEENIPSWLKGDQNVMGGTKETTPLVSPTRGSLGHSTSYGGQSASSNEQNTEVDYGDDDDEEAAVGDYSHNPNVDTSWAAEPPSKENSRPTVTFQDAQEEEEESSSSDESYDDDDDDDDDSDSSSSSEEEDDDVEANNRKKNWHKSPPRVPVNEKTPLQKKKMKKRSKRGKATFEEEDDESLLIKPRRNCCHSFFIVVQIAAVLANLCMITLEVVPAIYVLKAGKPNALQILDLVLRSYFTFFSTLFLVSELEFFDSSLNNWVTKGFLYSFLGVVAKEQHLAMLANGTLVVKQNTKAYWNGVWAALFAQVSSWWIIGIGILYFLMGIFCLKGMRNRFRVQYQARLRAYKDEKKRK